MSEGMGGWLDFERPLVELEQKIAEFRDFADGEKIEIRDELRRLETKAEKLRTQIFTGLTRWQRVQLARHPRRPYTLDYLQRLTGCFLELKGDRGFGDDRAIVGGLASFRGRKVMVVGHQKGRDIKAKLERNFGMPHPEGYRKALRLMEMAARFGRPIFTFIDTQGAYPGIAAEERGQSEAIARNLLVMARLPVPIVGIVIGEGGSGGALALGVCDRTFMQENSVYSVISPEGCAAILWGDRARAPEAAEALKVTAQDLSKLGVIDGIIPEPPGGAHRDVDAAATSVGDTLDSALAELEQLSPAELVEARLQRFLAMGSYLEDGLPKGLGHS
ncbi:MAG: acetyl-coenzyme A carboxylase carboxyl transferase subunit alpha [Gemmatimonadota bacterium]|nr:MAG: acetyl-coenzyme A carboxylase carboxyl transferase subunit alpha [Gemmatimonadota bacterium]